MRKNITAVYLERDWYLEFITTQENDRNNPLDNIKWLNISQEDEQMVNKYTEYFSRSVITREMQIKTAMSNHVTYWSGYDRWGIMGSEENVAECMLCMVLPGVQIDTPTEEDHVMISLN